MCHSGGSRRKSRQVALATSITSPILAGMRPKPYLMGVLNVTPDSFSDGGAFLDRERALLQAEWLVREGADILDIGGESTRPNAEPVSENEEMARVLPVVEAIRARFEVRLSVDTTKPAVAREAVRLGATIVNDVSGVAMAPAEFPATTIFLLMHRRGTPRDMATLTEYPRGVVVEVKEFLQERVRFFESAGVACERIWVDPGIGFAKRAEQSLELLRGLDAFVGVGGRLAIGTSRKSFLSAVPSGVPIELAQREPGTLASNLWAYAKGASVFRVHDVGALRRALSTWEGIENAG